MNYGNAGNNCSKSFLFRPPFYPYLFMICFSPSTPTSSFYKHSQRRILPHFYFLICKVRVYTHPLVSISIFLWWAFVPSAAAGCEELRLKNIDLYHTKPCSNHSCLPLRKGTLLALYMAWSIHTRTVVKSYLHLPCFCWIRGVLIAPINQMATKTT
jgi:hypothetical protein